MIPFLKQKAFLDLFPTPEFLLLSTTGIAITDENIKFVQLQKEIFRSGFKPVHLGKADNSKGVVESGVISKPDELVSVLKELSSRYDAHYSYATLPEERSYLFTATIDWVPPSGLRDAVAFIIEENAPVSLAESIFDFEIISEDLKAGKIKLAVSVLPKDIVNTYVGLFEAAGITPISFDIESQAIARAVIHHGDKRPHLIINLSSKKTGFYVVEDEVVQFSTTPTYSLGGDSSYPSLDDLRAEMRKVLTFWNVRADKSDRPDKKIEKVLLCGTGASREDLVDKLMSGSDVRYALADVWVNASPSRDYDPGVSFSESLDYASVIGSVLSRGR